MWLRATVVAVGRDKDPDCQPLDRLLADHSRCLALRKDHFSYIGLNRTAGLHRQPVDRPWHERTLHVADPDRNIIEFVPTLR